MTVSELTHGRGTQMSAKELAVDWPLFFAYRNRARKREEEAAKANRGRQ